MEMESARKGRGRAVLRVGNVEYRVRRSSHSTVSSETPTRDPSAWLVEPNMNIEHLPCITIRVLYLFPTPRHVVSCTCILP